MVYLFDVPAYFILLRETLEATIILAVLLGFIDKLVLEDESVRKKLKRQIWYGTAAGLGVSLLIGAIFIAVFYTIKRNLWEESEAAWEGSFCLIASIVITFMALSMLRVNQWRAKWENKLREATENYLKKHERGNKWALILLPFTVVCREGVETFVFMAGIGFQNPATGLPIPIILGIFTGFLIGFVIYKGSHRMSMAVFFNITTVFLLFVAAGLFSTSIHELQEATETYEHVLWELDCCNTKNRFWSLMSTIFGWRNKATVGTTVGYFIYWVFVGLVAAFMLYKEKKKHNDQSNNVEKNERDEREERDEKDDQAAIVNVA